jgi:hypothetical protein
MCFVKVGIRVDRLDSVGVNDIALKMGDIESFGLLFKSFVSFPSCIHDEVEMDSPGSSAQEMASLRDQGIDPACHAGAQWLGEAPSSNDFLVHLSKRIVTLMNNVRLTFSIRLLILLLH